MCLSPPVPTDQQKLPPFTENTEKISLLAPPKQKKFHASFVPAMESEIILTDKMFYGKTIMVFEYSNSLQQMNSHSSITVLCILFCVCPRKKVRVRVLFSHFYLVANIRRVS